MVTLGIVAGVVISATILETVLEAIGQTGKAKMLHILVYITVGGIVIGVLSTTLKDIKGMFHIF